MKAVRFYLRLFKSLVVRYQFVIFFSFLVGIFSFFLLPKVLVFFPKIKKTDKMGIIGRFKASEIPLSIQSKISYGLTTIDQKGLPQPKAALEWEITDEGKTYTFKLQNNLSWHDKSRLSSKDINYNFDDVEIEFVDDQTIRFKLKEPFAPFLDVVSKPIFKKGLVGLGDYKIKKITQNGSYLETIFLESIVDNQPNILYRFYPTEENAKIAFKLGEVNHLTGIINKDGFESWQNMESTVYVSRDRYVGLFFNLNKTNFDDKGIRQGLAYALTKDYQENKVLGPIAPTSWAYNDEVKPYNYDLSKAKKAIEKPFTVKLLTGSSLLSEAEKIKKEWELLGLRVEIGSYTGNEDFDVLLAIQEIPRDPDQYSLWHSTQAGNITGFRNARIDKLLEDGRKTLDQDQRRELYFDFQRYLLEDLPVIFLYYPQTFDIRRK